MDSDLDPPRSGTVRDSAKPGGEAGRENVIPLPARAPAGRPKEEPGKHGADDASPDPRTNLVVLVVAVVIVALGFLLMKELSDTSKVNDCILSGRKNCVPLDIPAKGSWLDRTWCGIRAA